jgi:integrase
MTQGTGKRGPRGAGSVRERKPGYWEVRVPVRAADGRPTQVSRYVTGTRKDAEKVRRTLLEEVDKGHHRQRKKSVGDLFERWFDLVSPDRSPATVRRYRSNLDNHILPTIGRLPLERLGPAELDELYVALRKKPTKTGRPMKPSSVNAVYQVIHTGLAYGVQVGWLVNNPADRSTPPKGRSRPIEPPEWSDVAKLVSVAMERDQETMAVLIFLAAATGMRRGELAGLRWGSLDEQQVNVWQAVIDAGAGQTLVKETKNHRYRTIAVAPEVLPFLAAHRERMERRAADVEVTLPPRAFVFSDSVTCAMPLSPGAITDRFGRIREWAGLPTVRLHDLRHLQATFLFAQGYDAVEIGARLGHAGGALALQLYGHFSPARDRIAAASLGSVLPALVTNERSPAAGH